MPEEEVPHVFDFSAENPAKPEKLTVDLQTKRILLVTARPKQGGRESKNGSFRYFIQESRFSCLQFFDLRGILKNFIKQ